MVDTGWKCDVCGEIYSELEYAEECEQEHASTPQSVSVKKVLYDPGAEVPRLLVVSFGEEFPDMTYEFAHVGDPDI